MRHTAADDESRERSAAYALGALTQHEARAFEEHLREGCGICATELRQFEEVVACLAWSAPEVAPRAAVRDQLLAAVGREAATGASPPTSDAVTAAAELLVVRTDEGRWSATADPGVSVKLLFVDREHDTVTSLVRLAPGARVPEHRHLGVEQCLVLEGDITSAGVRLTAGDYNCAMPGSIHAELTTEGGALLLIVAPERYELLS